MDTIDDIVRMSIEDLFPDHTIPDENNILPDGSRYKAPDHSILDGRLVIERKSRNSKDEGQFYQKLLRISSEQGYPIRGYGKINAKRVIDRLPDPKSASRKLIAFTTNRAMTRLRDARKKFAIYRQHVSVLDQVSMAILSDNTQLQESTDHWQFEIGRRMGAYSDAEDQLESIDVVMYVKHPKFVLDKSKAYWICILVRSRLSKDQIELVRHFASAIHIRVSTHADIRPHAENFPGELTLLFV